MKAERRHELKTNTLDKVLTGAPDVGRRYGGMLLLVVLAAIVGYMLIRYRVSATREAHRVATENLATARTSINLLTQLEMFPFPPREKAERRKQWSDDARNAIDLVTSSATDPTLLAEALLARGDLNWTLAQLSDLPGAATQPSLQLGADRKALLGEAESAYDQVRTAYGDQKLAVRAAEFGLAAIYENNGDWEKAKQKYQQIIDDASAPQAFKTQAQIRLEKAAEWSQPVLLAAATQPAATAPSSGVPLVSPTTAPATVATQPSTTQPVER